MAKKKWNWAKGYEQRTKDKQRENDQAALAKKRKEWESMKPYNRTRAGRESSLEASYEQQLAMEAQRTEDYRNAWEAEKQINRANSERLTGLQRQLATDRKKSFLRGMGFGIGLTLIGLGMLGALLKLIS